jgi:AcrR family transcriptional regulator
MSTGRYTNHRENQKEWILEVAEDLFIKNGIESVTIGSIAKSSRLTRATLYKYFANKEQIALEIFKTITRGWRDRDERDVWNAPGNGYQRLEIFISTFFDQLFQKPRETRFVAEFNYLYARKWPTKMVMKILSENLGEDRQFVLDCIRQGVEDGSLRKDIDPTLVLASIFNFNSGMLSRIGEMGTKVEGEYGLNVETIFQQICRIYLEGLKARPSDQAPINVQNPTGYKS